MSEPAPHVVNVADVGLENLLVHDAHAQDPGVAFGLSRLSHPDTLQDTPIGIFRDVQRTSYDALMREQMARALEPNGAGDLGALLRGSDTWTV